jgi:hypothetical protein
MPALIATGALMFSKLGARKLKVSLTATGKHRLSEADSIRLTAKPVSPDRRAGFSVTKIFTLKP